jgi:drug/metabolite transporter (DMT)-like permease
MTPLLVAAVSQRTVGEAAARAQVVGALLVAAGAVVYFSGSLGATTVGMVAALIGLIANVASALLGRWVNRSGTSSPLITTTVSIAVGASLLVAIGLIVEGTPRLSGRAVLAIAWLAVVNTALAFTVWNHSLRHLGATESAVINNTMLVQIALLAWVFLDEVPSLLQFLGIAAITVGVIWSQRRSPGATTADIPPAPPR